MRLLAFARTRLVPLGVLSTGVVCPCHVLVNAIALFTGGAVLSPAAQDGVHAVYVPFAVVTGALLLRTHARPREADHRSR
jgi:hypothetical protein